MEKGKILKSTGKWYDVELQNGEVISCTIRGKIRLNNIKSTNPVAVGDEVMIEREDERQGIVKEICPRRNFIVRKSVNLSKQSHILAANIDRAYLLVTLVAPETHLTFIDRFLVAAESYRIPVTLLFNKIDLYFEEHLPVVDNVIAIYEKIGYPCYKISAKNRENTEFLKEEIKDKQVMIAGHSGTGKSTLINALDDTLNLKTAQISMHHLQGQHTTTFAEMHALKSGGHIIDTPGIKAFGVVELEKSVMSHYFPEMRKMLNDCKYHNCQHMNEPQCAVKEAVEAGEIAESRYKTYLGLMTEDQTQTYR
ncbi:MAG: ribosome small subunit-dependent GTPase A [Brumimicrobium sp.]|nr:ribosome small subunit-dependent GTPase A [Brumimicrobium sp.]